MDSLTKVQKLAAIICIFLAIIVMPLALNDDTASDNLLLYRAIVCCTGVAICAIVFVLDLHKNKF